MECRISRITCVVFLFFSLSSTLHAVESEATRVCHDNGECDRSQYCSKPAAQCDLKSYGLCTTRPQVCTFQYDPVCGCDGNTYGNACSAASSGVNVAYQGECQNTPEKGTGNMPYNENYLIQSARLEVKDCIKQAREPGWDIDSSVQTVSACFAGGYITDVIFSKKPSCRPNEICPLAPVILVASVQFGCDNAVISSQCYSGPAVAMTKFSQESNIK